MDPKLLLELVKSPLGIVGLAMASLWVISRSNASLTSAIKTILPAIEESVKQLGARLAHHDNMVKANTDQQHQTQNVVQDLKRTIDTHRNEIDYLRRSLNHTDSMLANLTTQVGLHNSLMERFITMAKQKAAGLTEEPIPGTDKSKFKKGSGG